MNLLFSCYENISAAIEIILEANFFSNYCYEQRNNTIYDSPSSNDNAGSTADKGKCRMQYKTVANPEASRYGGSSKDQKGNTDEQRKAVDWVSECDMISLGWKYSSPIEACRKLYKKVVIILHPNKDRYEGTLKAFRMCLEWFKIARFDSKYIADFIIRCRLSS